MVSHLNSLYPLLVCFFLFPLSIHIVPRYAVMFLYVVTLNAANTRPSGVFPSLAQMN